MDMNHELPTIVDSRWFEWRAFWRTRMAAYWALGSVNPAAYWRL